ncbi:hypothetical protein [Clavibacter nebraskensis]|uniref:Anti-sigma factor n=2 Tax=Clavibacter nebraskensis TaxID=31963 RepID=A0A399PZY4_9MICO|nr:hypothetical protein [Clavibacter nebraskensis]KXU22006.1 hypothetical protein VV38_01445 [Clavibacter nebraskensis]OAH18736.1 hypothetical protein A3Q38_09795 [Clavibacter nebraskensis]QGV65686.1 hypothetical protein EGX36_01810 [Clavibacter nebraskensis]QGV68481.1 hypothetical protein EGX37_01795 [Clavibacter nebraskensis]QGV71272.1 hypothetical protein EGX35_01795 [Clavibacter nebraskensis]
MDEAQRGELRELRRRAYGPRPDLDDAELDRLRELEARQGGTAVASSPVRAAAPGTPPAARPAGPALEEHIPAVDHSDDDDALASGPPAPRRRGTAILWAASALVAVGATVALTSGFASMTDREVATVALDPDRPVPDRWDAWYQDVATGVGEFHGLTVIGLENPEDDAACVTVVAPRFARGTNPVGGCAAGSFPARGVLTVTGDMPAELRDEFPEGTALEFVLEGGSVRVTAG